MKYKISVIMPIYNAEKHLDNTIQSIINQSIGFENIELILVDDASKDNSKKIIGYYDNNYENVISYYSEKNHGHPGFGRNIGLKKATSEYIMFIDNDDEYDKDMCKTLYDTIIRTEADIVVCGRLKLDKLGNIKEKIPLIKGKEKNEIAILENDDLLYFNSHIILNKIFKNEIITANNLKFHENSRLDDDMFTWDYYMNSKKLVYLTNYYGYYWNVRSDSLSHTNAEKYIPEFIECILYEYNQLKKENKQQHITYRAQNAITGMIIESSYAKLKHHEFKKLLIKIHDFEKEINFNGKINSNWFGPINTLILNKHFTTAIILLKLISSLRRITIFRKINRKIKH